MLINVLRKCWLPLLLLLSKVCEEEEGSGRRHSGRVDCFSPTCVRKGTTQRIAEVMPMMSREVLLFPTDTTFSLTL